MKLLFRHGFERRKKKKENSFSFNRQSLFAKKQKEQKKLSAEMFIESWIARFGPPTKFVYSCLGGLVHRCFFRDVFHSCPGGFSLPVEGEEKKKFYLINLILVKAKKKFVIV